MGCDNFSRDYALPSAGMKSLSVGGGDQAPAKRGASPSARRRDAPTLAVG